MLARWRETMAADGFVACCEHCPQGERFRIAARDQSMVLELLYNDIAVTSPLTEADLRTKFMHMGLSAEAVDAKIQMARDFGEARSSYLGPMIRFSN